MRAFTLFALVASLLVPSSVLGQRRAAQENQENSGETASAPPTIRDLPQVVERLQSEDADQVREAIDQLVVIDDAQVIEPIATLLRSGQSDHLTDHALAALGSLKKVEGIEVLTEFTHHRRPGARRRAYHALAAIEDARVVPILEAGLRDSDRGIRGVAAIALGERGATDSLELLFRAFERNVVEAAIAIGQLAPNEAVDRYNGFLGNEPLGVMLSGYEHLLRRDDISLETKTAIVERLGEVAGVMVRRFLQSYLNTFPERFRRRDREVRELRDLVRDTMVRIPEQASGETIRPGGAS